MNFALLRSSVWKDASWFRKSAETFTVLWACFTVNSGINYYFTASPKAENPDQQLEVLLEKFRDQAVLQFLIDYPSTFGPSQNAFASRELLDPSTFLPQAFRYDRFTLMQLVAREKNCGLNPLKEVQ